MIKVSLWWPLVVENSMTAGLVKAELVVRPGKDYLPSHAGAEQC